MAITLPIGIRLAAGLLGATIDRIGNLPQELPTLGVSLAGQAVRTSFRIRQEIAELATRGDELLAGITGRPQEKPAWATFDEDQDPSDGPTPVPPPAPPVDVAGSTERARTGSRARSAAKPATPVTVPVPSNRLRPSRGGAAPSPSARASVRSIAGDHLLSLAELKEKLQGIDVSGVRELLAMEENGPNRAAYLTLLTNRLTTLAHENGQSPSR